MIGSMRFVTWVFLTACKFEPGVISRDAGNLGNAMDATEAMDGPIGDAPSVDAATPTCPANYTLDANGSAYRFVNTAALWLAAEQDCEDDLVDRTHLVVLDQAGEVMIVDAISTATVWFGSSNRIDLGSWRWVTGATAPDLGNTPGRCGRYSPEYNNDNDDDCTATSWAYVCECDHVRALPGVAY